MIHGVTKNQLEEPLLTPLDEWWTLTSKSLEVYAQYAFSQTKRDTSKDRGCSEKTGLYSAMPKWEHG
jgi:hypothetical protein